MGELQQQTAAGQSECLHSELSYKRLEAGRFVRSWPDIRSGEIDCTALKLMLEGIEVKRQYKRYRHEQGR